MSVWMQSIGSYVVDGDVAFEQCGTCGRCFADGSPAFGDGIFWDSSFFGWQCRHTDGDEGVLV